MDDGPEKLRAKEARAEVSRRLRSYHTSLCLGFQDRAAEMLERVERLSAQREPEVPNHPGYPLT